MTDLRQTFERLAKADFPEIDLAIDGDEYRNVVTRAQWRGYLMARQAVAPALSETLTLGLVQQDVELFFVGLYDGQRVTTLIAGPFVNFADAAHVGLGGVLRAGEYKVCSASLPIELRIAETQVDDE